MHTAHVSSADCTGLSIGGDEVILSPVAYVLGGMILDILRADDAMNSWLVVVTVLLWIGALTFHRYEQRTPIWIAFVWFVLDAFVLSNRGDHR